MWRKWEKVRDRICGYAEGIYDGDWCGIGIGEGGDKGVRDALWVSVVCVFKQV